MQKSRVSLNDWYNERFSRLTNFTHFWRSQQKRRGKEVYPDELDEEEWDEQLSFWVENVEEKE